MKSQRGFIVPLLILIGVVVLGGIAYFYAKHTSTAPVTTTTSTTVYNAASSSDAVSNSTDPSGAAGASQATTQGSAGNPDLVQTGTQGVLPQRLGWQTYTNIDYSYAISHPDSWTVSGASSLVSLSDGRAVVSIQSYNVSAGIDPTTFATQNGAYGGFVTTKVNAYTALQTAEGANTAYYIVNGAVGYKILVSSALTSDEADIVHAMLVEFTVTKQR